MECTLPFSLPGGYPEQLDEPALLSDGGAEERAKRFRRSQLLRPLHLSDVLRSQGDSSTSQRSTSPTAAVHPPLAGPGAWPVQGSLFREGRVAHSYHPVPPVTPFGTAPLRTEEAT